MLKAIIIFSVVFLTLACSKEKEITIAESSTKQDSVKLETIKVKIENQSPDKTVQSRWKLKDYRTAKYTELCLKQKEYFDNQIKENKELFIHVTDGLVLKSDIADDYKCSTNIYSRDITEVKQESETRSIVFAKIKNITPIPAGAVPDEFDLETRNEGVNYKYVLEKMSDGWKINQVYKYNKDHKILNQDEWEKMYKEEEKISVPQFVFVD